MSKWRRKVDYSAVPRWAKLIFIIACVNWFIFFAVVFTIGGVALDTQPANGRFYVVSHGVQQKDVSEATWVFSLFYSYASLILLPVGICCGVAYLHRIKYKDLKKEESVIPKSGRVYLYIAIGLFTVIWVYSLTGGLIRSISAWMRMG